MSLNPIIFPFFYSLFRPTSFVELSTYISVTIGLNLLFNVYGDIDNHIKATWDKHNTKTVNHIEQFEKACQNAKIDNYKILIELLNKAFDKVKKRQAVWTDNQQPIIKKFCQALAIVYTVVGVILLLLGSQLDFIYKNTGISLFILLVLPLPAYFLAGHFEITMTNLQLSLAKRRINTLMKDLLPVSIEAE